MTKNNALPELLPGILDHLTLNDLDDTFNDVLTGLVPILEYTQSQPENDKMAVGRFTNLMYIALLGRSPREIACRWVGKAPDLQLTPQGKQFLETKESFNYLTETQGVLPTVLKVMTKLEGRPKWLVPKHDGGLFATSSTLNQDAADAFKRAAPLYDGKLCGMVFAPIDCLDVRATDPKLTHRLAGVFAVDSTDEEIVNKTRYIEFIYNLKKLFEFIIQALFYGHYDLMLGEYGVFNQAYLRMLLSGSLKW